MAKNRVFISFRGDDTRAKFTSHFHRRLVEKKIETYIDYRLEKGEEISSALLRAIEESKIAVVIFSENYADSRWCLDELVHILECRQEKGMIVVPVFYQVDPSHVRKQSHSYEAALLGLAGRFEAKRLQKWREALTETADLAGFDSRRYRLESEFVDAVIEDILGKLTCSSSSSDEFKGIIGIDKKVEEVEKLLSIRSPKRLMVGIWGMGGVGKTTLARVVFEKLSSRFEGCCFLENVREETGKRGLEELQVKLVSVLLGEDNIKKVSSFHKDRLRRKRVLVVLDDVDEFDHLESLAGGDEWFGVGSRIIVTTRNAEVLRNRAEEIFELTGLNSKDALELFNSKAFMRTAPSAKDVELSKRVVKYVDGIPLALTVLGSYFRSKRRESWEEELDKLNEVPNHTIYTALKRSYDGLDEMERSIFLDIACFSEGHLSRNSANCIFGDSFVNIGIDSLIDKSLISSKGHHLVMHDLVREMGQEIVRQQSTEEPGKRSRIWASKDVYHVFKNNTGTSKIEGISQGSYWTFGVVDLSPTFFSRMHNLRLLNIGDYYRKWQVPEGLQYLPDTLTCLACTSWPLKSLPTNFKPHNLVVLMMRFSKLKKLWNGVHDLRNLRYINLSNSENLSELPDLSQASNLEYVNLRGCTSLRRVPSCLRFRVVDNLSLLSQCDLKCDSWQCWTIGYLDLTGCKVLEIFPEISGSVKVLICNIYSIAHLPSLICLLKSIVELHLNLDNIKELPSYLFEGLSCLEELDLSGSTELLRLPSNIWKLKSLRSINLSLLQSLPEIYLFEGLSCLEKLNLFRCINLLRLPSNMKSLRSINLSLCCKLQSFPEILEPMETLEILDLSFSLIRELPTSIENLVGLKSLKMEVCRYLETLPRSMSMLSRLQDINLCLCYRLMRLPPLPVSLKSLDLSECYALKYLPENINQLHNLTTLRIRDCKSLEYLPELPLSLQYLDVSGCKNLEVVSDSRSVLAQGWGNNDYSLEPREFLFIDCFRLDRDMCNIIVTEFQMRSLFAAAIYASKRNDPEGTTGYRGVNVGFPGNKIPEWFNVQFEGPSLHFTFPSHCHDINFLGVAVCAVVKGAFAPIEWSCEISVKSNQDVSVFTSWPFARELQRGTLLFLREGKENMLMWYVHDDCLSWLDVAELGIKFYGKGKGVVKSCGFRLLQLQDIEEFGVATGQCARLET